MTKILISTKLVPFPSNLHSLLLDFFELFMNLLIFSMPKKSFVVQ